MGVLLEQMERLRKLIADEGESVEAIEEVVKDLQAQRERHEFQLRQIESVLGKTAQIQLEDSNLLLRGQRIGEVAVEILAAERDGQAELHYRDWYKLLKDRGHVVAGKDPVNSFLTQINRSPRIQRVGKRTGIYRLLEQVA